MPIIDLALDRYERVPTPTKDDPDDYSYRRVSLFNGLCLKKSFKTQMMIRKANVKFGCMCCGKQRGKGTRYIGDNWSKICMFCLKEWMINSKKTIKEMEEVIEDQGKLLKINEDKWYKEALVGQLE